MNLLIDIGNSRIKWAAHSPNSSALTQHVLEAAGIDVLGRRFDAAWGGLPKPQAVLYCTVGGQESVDAVHRWVASRWGLRLRRVVSEARGFGVTNGYREPTQLGDDRWVAIVAAHRHFPGGTCVVDCGTAMTIDAINGDGRHLGGMIVPGLQLMRDALALGTQGVGQRDTGEFVPLARDTAGAVVSGTLYAVLGSVERSLGAIEVALEEPPRCIITGGGGEVLSHFLDYTHVYEPALVLMGLAAIADTPL